MQARCNSRQLSDTEQRWVEVPNFWFADYPLDRAIHQAGQETLEQRTIL
jgi:hypothetical protein